MLREAMKRRGYEVQACPDPVAGMVSMVRFRPQLVFLDVRMPAGGGGVFYNALRKHPEFKDLLVIVATASEDTGSVYGIFGATSHPKTLILRKPMDLAVLYALLGKVLPPG